MDITNAFGIDHTNMYFGASLFDMRSMDIDRNMIDYVYNSLSSLNPGHMPEIFAGTMWMTANPDREFDWRKKNKTFERCYECLGKDGFLHSSNFFEAEAVPFIVSHLRWQYGDKICDEGTLIDLSLYQKGVIDQMWTVDPLTVRWYTKIKSDNGPDYLYLLGGSPELFDEPNPTNEDHLTAHYGFYRYLSLAQEKLGLTTIYERRGSQEFAYDINYILPEIKEFLHEVL